MKLEVGQAAPAVELYSDEKSLVTLAELHGDKNILLLFFPAAFTGVCTNELSTVSNDLESYGSDTQVLGISTDSPFTLSEFKKVLDLKFPLLSDHNGSVSEMYGVKYSNDFTHMNLDKIAKRSAFVINKEGTLGYVEVLENAGDMPDLEKIKSTLNAL